MEFNDVYDRNRNLTGKIHQRGRKWRFGEYGLVVCAWVYDGRGNLLLTRRAPGKTFAGTWENSGGAAKVGESSRQAIVRELFEETGIRAEESDFELLASERHRHTHYDFYCLKREVPLEEIVLLPGETDAARWATMDEVRGMVRDGQICRIIGRQFRRQEPDLLARQNIQE